MSTIVGLITNAGLAAAQESANNEGFNLVPTRFGISDVAGTIDPNRSTSTSGLFYSAPISSRVVIDQNTIRFTLTTPPNSIPEGTSRIVREIYLFINNAQGDEILFAVGQPTEEIRYNPQDELTLDVEMAIVNLNVVDNFVFTFTQAPEISAHNLDPAAHPEWVEAMRKAGIFLPAGSIPSERRGQVFEDNNGNGVEFDGTKATFLHEGINFIATFNGTELNGAEVTFDGTLTTDQIRLAFNNLNYPNTIEHDGDGSEILGGGVKVLSSGSYNLQEKDIVYKDIDNVYKRAIADGTIRSRVAGVALLEDKTVLMHGLIDLNTGFGISESVYLSGNAEGALTNFDTNINLGIALGEFIFFTGFSGDLNTNVSQEFDAAVTNSSGLGQFLTTQEAIESVGQYGRILVNICEEVRETIDTQGKNLTLVVNGPANGWKRFGGLSTGFQINFDQVPTQGTFRIEWELQETNDIPFSASASDIQTEFNLLNGHNGVTVSGDFSSGFVVGFIDQEEYPLPTFNFAGLNEIQRLEFDNIPTDGTITLRHEGQDTLNFPWDDNAQDLELALEAISSIVSVDVSGSFDDGFFQIEFVGGFLNDGLQEQGTIEVIQNDLDLLGVSTSVNGSTLIPTEAEVAQRGRKPASNLYNGLTLINITTLQTQTGELPGPERAFNVDTGLVQIVGMGKIENFEEGIVLANAATNVKIEAYFPNTVCPIVSADKIPGIDYDLEAHGFAKDVLSQFRVTEHPTNKKRLKISGADVILASGIKLSQSTSNNLMDFDGAEIDFSVDPIVIYKADGITPLGGTFARPSIAAGAFRWLSINLKEGLIGSDKSNQAVIELVSAESDGINSDIAEKAILGDIPLGMVAIEGALGDKEKTLITTTRDLFGDKKGTTFILNHPTESVAFWFSDSSLDTLTSVFDTGVSGSDQDLFNSSANRVLAARVTPDNNYTIDSLGLFLQRNGLPTGDISVRVLGEQAGEPDLNNVLANGVAILDLESIPLNFASRVVVELDTEINVTSGSNIYVEINGDNLILTAGNFLGWNSEDNGSVVNIFNRDTAATSWSQTLGNRTANIQLISTVKGVPALASTADRNVEITTLVENDFQVDVAQKIATAIGADSLFSVTQSDNRVEIENTLLGDVVDANVGDTGFFSEVLVQGTDTDLTGIEDINNKSIRQFSYGSGRGAALSKISDLSSPFKNEIANDVDDVSLQFNGEDIEFDSDLIIGTSFSYNLVRNTSTASAVQQGIINVAFEPKQGVWRISWDFNFDDVMVKFDVEPIVGTTRARLTYSSKELTGLDYFGELTLVRNRNIEKVL